MTIVTEQHARKSMLKRAIHHAPKLVPYIEPTMNMVMAFADKDDKFYSRWDGFTSVKGRAITCQKTTGSFRVNGKWYGYRGSYDTNADEYNGFEFFDWETKKAISNFPT